MHRSTTSFRCPVMTISSSTSRPFTASMTSSITGRPATRTRGLGTRLVSGSRRVPLPASGTMTFTSHPPVAVFEPHHVVDLGRRGLEQVARHHRLELMDQLGLDVERRPLRHGPFDQRIAPLD